MLLAQLFEVQETRLANDPQDALPVTLPVLLPVLVPELTVLVSDERRRGSIVLLIAFFFFAGLRDRFAAGLDVRGRRGARFESVRCFPAVLRGDFWVGRGDTLLSSSMGVSARWSFTSTLGCLSATRLVDRAFEGCSVPTKTSCS